MATPLLSLAEAAIVLSRTPGTLAAVVTSGALPIVEVDGETRVPLDRLIAVIADPRTGSRRRRRSRVRPARPVPALRLVASRIAVMSDDYDDMVDALARQHAGEVAASRLELTLWTLVKDDRRAVARTRRHPAGLELVVLVAGDLLACEAFTAATVDGLEAAAAKYRDALLADGWTDAGPRG